MKGASLPLLLAVFATLWLPSPSFSADPFDVVADLQSRGGRTVVAHVSAREISCASFTGAWLGITADGRDLFLEVAGLPRMRLSHESIADWGDQIRTRLSETSSAVGKARTERSFGQEIRDLLDRYSDPLGNGVAAPPIKVRVTSQANSQDVALAGALYARLATFRNDIRRQVPNANLAAQQFACLYEFEALPAIVSSEDGRTRASLVAVPSSSPSTRDPTQTIQATGADLMRLISKQPPALRSVN